MRDKLGRFTKGTLPITAFKKWHIAWNKGKKCPQIAKSKIGSKNPCWKGGKAKHDGYILIKQPFHPNCNQYGYVKRAVLVMEKHLGRFLKPEEVVHHINGIKDDDRIENLKLFKSNSSHIQFHWDNGFSPHHKKSL